MKRIPIPTLLLIALGGLFILLPGCATSNPGSGHAAADGPDGARLWAQNCVRCHNNRSPTEYSEAQWDIVLLHMRVRAGLTANDSQAIREFLQTAN